MRARLKSFYTFIETIPDRLYPFASEIEGRWVRGRRSYLQTLERVYEEYGPNRFGLKLSVYRGACHLLGSILFLLGATVISHRLFGSEVALYIMIAAAILMLSVQEFYLHPKRYGQHRGKGIADWLTWVLPMAVYLSFALPV